MKMKYIALALAAILAVALCGCAKTEAPVQTQEQVVSPADQALRCYQEILRAASGITGEHAELQDAAFGAEENREKFGEHIDEFAIVDLNQDGVPELIASTVINWRWTQISVFTCVDGKAVLLHDPMNTDAACTFEQNSSANGAYRTFICADNHIHSVWQGSTPAGEMTEGIGCALRGAVLEVANCAAAEGTDFSDLAKPNTEQNVAAILSA